MCFKMAKVNGSITVSYRESIDGDEASLATKFMDAGAILENPLNTRKEIAHEK